MERVNMEKAKGTADMQAELARSAVGVDIKTNDATAREREGAGEAAYIEQTGAGGTTMVNAVEAPARGNVPFVPEVLVTGGGGALDALAATLTDALRPERAQDSGAPDADDADDADDAKHVRDAERAQPSEHAAEGGAVAQALPGELVAEPA